MTQYVDSLRSLRRPSLLIRAARHGLMEYDRNKDLRRILPGMETPAPGQAVPALLESEARHEATRKAGVAGYSVTKHLETLIALMAEARLIL